MVMCARIRAYTTLHAPLDVFDSLSLIDLAVDVAQTFHHFFRLNTWQEDGRNEFGLSIRPLHLYRACVHVGDARFYERSTYEAIHWVARRQDKKKPSAGDAETKNQMGGARPSRSSRYQSDDLNG